MINLNLLPPEIKQKIVEAKKSANTVSWCLVCVLVLLFLGFVLYSVKTMLLAPNLENIKQNIADATQKMSSFSDLEKEALFLNERATIAEKIESSRANWSQIVQELANSVPTNVQFTNLSADVTKSPNFILQGKTLTERDIISFKDKLDESNFFKNVNFKSSTASAGSEESKNITFSLDFDLEKLSISTNQKSQGAQEVK
jgi:Tfp pilus assembly protein PilN